MHALSEEHARRTVQLRHDYALGAVDYEGAVAGHVRNGAKEHVLDKSSEVLMVGVGTVKLHLSLQGYAICQTALETLVNGVTRRVDIVIQELKDEVVARVADREVLREHLIETVILAFLRRSVQL